MKASPDSGSLLDSNIVLGNVVLALKPNLKQAVWIVRQKNQIDPRIIASL